MFFMEKSLGATFFGIFMSVLLGCEECETSSDCDTGQACIEGTCESAPPYNPGTDTDSDVDSDVDSDTDADSDTDIEHELEWVEIPGGSYWMGYAAGGGEELPVHLVDVPTFEMTRSEVTAAQYSECFAAGECEEPETGAQMNWQVPGRLLHPINGVYWENADNFCTFSGGRLPSEAEWEYAARSGGEELKYPWGSADPSCDYCIMEGPANIGCDEGHTWPVCSRPAGDTAHGLCDMSGNVYEWTADYHHNDYNGAPTDGSAWSVADPLNGNARTLRSGSYMEGPEMSGLRTSGRLGFTETGREPDLGFRCARDMSSEN